MDERRAQDLCFNYDEKFHRGHIYKAKLFVILVANEEHETGEEVDTIEESQLHSMPGKIKILPFLFETSSKIVKRDIKSQVGSFLFPHLTLV